MEDRQKIEQAIRALEAQRQVLGEEVTDASIASLREKLSVLSARSARRRKQVTLLLADLSGFTALSEQMDAEDVRHLMNTLWAELDRVIVGYGGYIDKHIGDAVLAFWGMEVAREDDPANAIRAALEIQQEVTRFSQKMQLRLQMRIGLHTGPVVLGEVGTQGEFTAVGEAMHLLSRLETLAPLGKVLISQDTYQHIRGLFVTEVYQQIDGKASQGALTTYLVRSVAPYSFQNPVRGIEGFSARMVGREAELHQLQKAFRALVTRRTLQALTLVGDAGLGKSRMLLEFQKWVETTPTRVFYFKARAEEQMQYQPFSLAQKLFGDIFQLSESDPREAALQKFELGAQAFLGADQIETVHLLGNLLGFDFSDSSYIRGIQDEIRQLHTRGIYAAVRFFKAAARQNPLVLILDDLHWADTGSRELLENLVRECGEEQILLIFATRPSFFEAYPTWGETWSQHQRLPLTSLNREESRVLLHDILRKLPELPGKLQDLLLENTEGNPFYLEEMIKMLIETGVVVQTAGEWTINLERLQVEKIPSTLSGILQARIDCLTPGERSLFQRASVIGRVFWEEALAFLFPDLERDGLENLLAALVSKELILRVENSVFGNSREYQFKHALLQEVTYEQVLKAERREAHGRVALWLADLVEDRAGQFAAVIARHFELAGENLPAAEWYGRAADQARKAYSTAEAAVYYRQALEFWGSQLEPQREYQLLEGLSDILRLQGELDEAQYFCERMVQIAEAQGAPTRQAVALNRLWAIFSRRGLYAEALAYSQRAAVLVRQADPPDLAILAQVIFQIGVTQFRIGKLDEVLQSGLESLALAEKANAKPQIASSCNLIALSYIPRGLLAEAMPYSLRSLEIWRELKHREHESDLLNNIGEYYRIAGDGRNALPYYEQGLQMGIEIGNRLTELGFLSNLCASYNLIGDYAQAREYLFRALEKVSSDTYLISEMHYNAAETWLGLEDLAQAKLHCLEALRFAYQLGSPELVGNAWRVAGRVASALAEPLTFDSPASGTLFSAQACFQQAETVFREAGMERDQALALWHWARHARQAGDLDLATGMVHAARSIFQRLNLSLLNAGLEAEFPVGV